MVLGDTMEILADKLRPQTLDDVIGQQHLVGKNSIIRNLVENNHLVSMILYGKPGIGKTSIACAICKQINKPYRMLNATINNKQDFDIVIEEAKMHGEMVVVMDEIHRLNKDKQDLLLPYIENGLIVLIGMTTSNPYHKINSAIRSRCQIFELKELSLEDIVTGINKACEYLKGIKIEDDVKKAIANLSSGDLRSAINLLEVAYYGSQDKNVTMEHLKSINQKAIFFSDANEDGHYDVLSGLQKSIRGSDVNASLHYLARLIEEGDLDSIYRRLSVIGYEDIGLANPSIGPKIMAAIHAAELVGLPEARIPLGTIVTEMALSPKSNSAHVALDMALEDIQNGSTGNLPEHLKTNSPLYKYPHDYPNSWVKQQYLPDRIKNKKYYKPVRNKYEDNLNKIHKEFTGE